MKNNDCLFKFAYYSIVFVVFSYVLSFLGYCLTIRGGVCMAVDPLINGVIIGGLFTLKDIVAKDLNRPVEK